MLSRLIALHRLAVLDPGATEIRMLAHGGLLNATREGVWLVSLPDFPAALAHAEPRAGTH